MGNLFLQAPLPLPPNGSGYDLELLVAMVIGLLGTVGIVAKAYVSLRDKIDARRDAAEQRRIEQDTKREDAAIASAAERDKLLREMEASRESRSLRILDQLEKGFEELDQRYDNERIRVDGRLDGMQREIQDITRGFRLIPPTSPPPSTTGNDK